MLPVRHRLRRRRDFAVAVRRGRRAGSPLLVAHLYNGEPSLSAVCAPQDASVDRRPPRVGFVVSRAVGGAVVRNAVKRRLRHLARPRIGLLPAGSFLVVRALPAAGTASTVDLTAELDAALRRVGVSTAEVRR